MTKILHFLNIFLAILIFLGLIFIGPAYAFEITYPTLFGITITNDTPPTLMIIYLFMFLVAIGSVIAFIILFSAGLKIMTASGEPAKISQAKNQIMGAFIGLIVLFCSYMILNTVNSNLTQVQVSSFDCSEVPICVEYTTIDPATNQAKTRLEMSIPLSNDNLKLKSGEKIVIKRYADLWELWTFPESNFGTPVDLDPAYRAPSLNIDPNNPTIVTDLTIDSSVKSYKLIPKAEGIYLYDREDYKISSGIAAPYQLNGDVPDFSQTSPEFFQKAQSFQVIKNISQPGTPSGIFFSEPKFRGFCAPLFKSVGLLGAEKIEPLVQVPNFTAPFNFTKLGGITAFGNNVASVLYFKVGLQNPGTVTFYDRPKCEGSSDVYKFTTDNIYMKPVSLISIITPENKAIKSIRIDGPAGVILVDGTRCQYFTNKDFTDGNCIASLEGSDVLNPTYFVLLPNEH